MAAASSSTRAELHATKGVTADRDPATTGYLLQQTMLRIKDPERSLDFYTRILGMTLVAKLDFPAAKFSLFFLAYTDKPSTISDDPADRIEHCFSREGVLELTHNHGTEDSDWQANTGNTEPKGFGHIGISVPSVQDACLRFESMDVDFIKKPDEGSMKNLAFIKDPDGYWIEVLNAAYSRRFV